MFAHPRQARVILNIGISITFLLSDKNHIQGWDIGPGTLMDAWCRKHKQQPIDWDGVGQTKRKQMNHCSTSYCQILYHVISAQKYRQRALQFTMA